MPATDYRGPTRERLANQSVIDQIMKIYARLKGRTAESDWPELGAELEVLSQNATLLAGHPTQTGHLINDVGQPLRPRMYRRDGGPPAPPWGQRDRRPCPALGRAAPRCLMEPPLQDAK